MTPEKETLFIIRGTIASLPTDDQIKVAQAVRDLKELLEKHGDYGDMALALVGAEKAAQ